jgi:hypothetical protein
MLASSSTLAEVDNLTEVSIKYNSGVPTESTLAAVRREVVINCLDDRRFVMVKYDWTPGAQIDFVQHRTEPA